MDKRKKCLALFVAILMFIPLLSTVINAEPTLTKPASYGEYKSTSSVTVKWTCSDTDISHYLISVREFTFDERKAGTASGGTGTSIIFNVNIGNVTSYSIPASLINRKSLYKCAVCAVKIDGSRSWSTPRYFYAGIHSGVSSPWVFSIWNGFATLTKSQIIDSADTWENVVNTSVFDTSSFTTNGTLNVVNSNDSINSITGESKGTSNQALMVTYSRINGYGTPLEVDINVNKSFDWANSAMPDKYDVQSAMTHEMGHALGLCDKYETDWSTSWTMYGFMSKNDISKRTLAARDVLDALTLYE